MRRLFPLLCCVPFLLDAQTPWFEDHFASPTVSDRWSAADGEWTMSAEGVQATAHHFGILLVSSCYCTDLQPYDIETEMRGPGSGISFSLDDNESFAVSQFVRLDNGRLLSGYVTASGVVVITAAFDSAATASAWTRLCVHVEPQNRRCSFMVNGRAIGGDTSLMFRAGYLGLLNAGGTATFRSIRVMGDTPQETVRRPAAGSAAHFNRVRFVRSSGANVQIYNPEIGYMQTIRPNGSIQGQSQTFRPPRGPLQAAAGGRIYEVGPSFLLVKDTRRHIIDTVRSHLVRPSAIIAVSSAAPHRRMKEASAPAGRTLLLVVDAGARGILKFSGTGEFLGEDRGTDFGGFRAPRGIDIMPNGEIVVADYDRLIFRNLDRQDLPPRLIIGSLLERPVGARNSLSAADSAPRLSH